MKIRKYSILGIAIPLITVLSLFIILSEIESELQLWHMVVYMTASAVFALGCEISQYIKD